MSQWPLCRLDALCDIAIGRTPPRSNPKFWDPSKSTGHVWLSIADLPHEAMTPIRASKEHLSDEGAAMVPVVPAGTLIMSFKLSIGRTAIAALDLRTNEAIAAFKNLRGDVDVRYLGYALQAHNWSTSDGANDKLMGVTLNKAKLANALLPIPPLDQQQRIVAKLDEVSLLGDRLELNSSSQLANSKELRARLLDEVFSEPAPWVPLGDVVEVLDSQRVPITKKDRVSGDVPYYGATGVQDFVADFLFDEDLVLLGEDGAKWSAGDRSAFLISGKAWVNNHAHVLRPDRSKVLDAWLAEWLCVTDLMPYVSGATVQKLNQARMKEILVPVPPVERQRDLTTRIACIHAGTQKLDANASAMLAESALLRRAALSSLLSSAS